MQGREVWLVKLEGIDSPEEAATVRGHTLLIPASARNALDDEDEFYVQDLVGLRVEMLATGEVVGTVVDLFDGTGRHDVLRIELAAPPPSEADAASAPAEKKPTKSAPAEKRHVMLPFAKELVPVVDVVAGVMRVCPPEGLFEITAPSTQRAPRRPENAVKKEKKPKLN